MGRPYQLLSIPVVVGERENVVAVLVRVRERRALVRVVVRAHPETNSQ